MRAMEAPSPTVPYTRAPPRSLTSPLPTLIKPPLPTLFRVSPLGAQVSSTAVLAVSFDIWFNEAMAVSFSGVARDRRFGIKTAGLLLLGGTARSLTFYRGWRRVQSEA